MKNKTKILITGVAGFIGSNLADRLLKEDFSVVGIDDFNDFYKPAWKEKNIAHHAGAANFRLYRGSITDKKFLNEVFQKEKIGKIVHLAARAGVRPSIQDPRLYYEVNVGGTLNLLEAARQNNIKDFIFASSSSVYGVSSKAPFSEEEPADKPISPYAATKRAGELLTYTYHNLFGMNCINLRFFTVYGERGRPDMAPYLFTEALLLGRSIKRFGDGSAKRDYTYVGDVVDGIARCLDKNFGYEIINLGNNSPVTLNGFISLLEEITGRKAKIEVSPEQSGDVPLTCADISKAHRLLDWRPKTALREGLDKFVRWYKKNRP